MRPSVVPSAVLVAAVLSVQACSQVYTSGCKDWDGSVTEEPVSRTLPVDEDGLVALEDGSLADPHTEDGCRAICQDYALDEVTEVHECTATGGSPTADSADSGLASATEVTVDCVVSGTQACIGGRHHACLERPSGAGPDGVAAWLAREAAGEAGSVLAFRRLEAELRAHGAPGALVAGAREAAADEVRHARSVGRLARSRGGRPSKLRARPPAARSLVELALENAVEGCVHETYAAARARWQSLRAEDDAIRDVSADLAADEARHADLAAALHAWVSTVLPEVDRRRVEAARREAWRALRESPPDVTDSVAAALGVPTGEEHRRLVDALATALA